MNLHTVVQNGKIVITDNGPIDVPKEVVVCPYCDALISVYIDGCIETGVGTGLFQADSIQTDCSNEPDIDSAEWDAWLAKHTYMPYIYQLPVDIKVMNWLNQHFIFKE